MAKDKKLPTTLCRITHGGCYPPTSSEKGSSGRPEEYKIGSEYRLTAGQMTTFANKFVLASEVKADDELAADSVVKDERIEELEGLLKGAATAEEVQTYLDSETELKQKVADLEAAAGTNAELLKEAQEKVESLDGIIVLKDELIKTRDERITELETAAKTKKAPGAN